MSDCFCNEREYMKLSDYIAKYPAAYSAAVASMTEFQKTLFEITFGDRFLYLPLQDYEDTPEPVPQKPSILDITALEMIGNADFAESDAGGISTESKFSIEYKDHSTGKSESHKISFLQKVPIEPGDLVEFENFGDLVKIGVEKKKLELDFWKISKTPVNTAPLWIASIGKPDYAATTNEADGGTFAYRDSSGSCKFHNIGLRNALTNDIGGSVSYADQICECVNPTYSEKTIAKTSTDTGTITAELLNDFKEYPQLHIIYDNQLYYRQDPLAAPDGTMNFIHTDAVQDENGGYTATGKCFSITVSTRAWRVVDVSFAGAEPARHPVRLSLQSGIETNFVQCFVDLYSVKKTGLSTDEIKTLLINGITGISAQVDGGTEKDYKPCFIQNAGNACAISYGASTDTYMWENVIAIDLIA